MRRTAPFELIALVVFIEPEHRRERRDAEPLYRLAHEKRVLDIDHDTFAAPERQLVGA